MSKLSFRARALDATKAMPIYRKDEVSDLPDYSVLNRAVPQMPTGMEKEEESEHHLQRAISAQQVYGHKKVMVIPVPEAEVGVQYYNSIYKKSYRLPKQYIHNQAQALNSIMEQERPDYDMDSEDERWVRDINKRTGLDIKEIQFEEMIDRLEKSCGNQVVSLQEAKLLLKEDDDLIKAVYDYWLQKRLKMIGPLVVQVRQERRDGSSSGDSYVAFRRRTEKMQTRKNRKNDEASYEKMLKLRRDLSRAVTILEMIKRREKSKRELLHLTLEIAEKRYQMKDWDGKFFKSAKREVAGPKSIKLVSRSKHPSGNRLPVGINPALLMKGKVGKLEVDRENGITQKKKRYRKHKHNKLHNFPTNMDGGLNGGSGHRHGVSSFKMPKMHSASALSSKPISSTGTNKVSVSATNSYSHLASLGSGAMAPRSNVGAEMTYQQVVDTMHQYEFQSSDEERPKSPLSGSLAPEEEKKKNPDGTFAFRRKPGCKYNAPLDDLSGDHWPWMTDERHRYSLTTLAVPEKCMGFCRRRVGRGGRILFDRAYSPWNKQLSEIDLNPEAQHLPHKQDLQELLQEIKHGRWRRYRPYDPKIHKTHKLLRIDKQDKECDKQSFGHSNATPVDGIQSKTSEPKGMSRTESNQVSSDSETVDIMTTDGEGSRGELLHKKLALQKTYYTKSLNSPSPLKHGMIHKRILESGLVPGGAALDKSTAMFAVSALVVSTASKVKTSYLTTDSKSHRSKVKSCRVQTPLKLNVVTAGTVSSSMMSTQTMLTTMAMQATNSPGKYIYSGVPIAETITPMSKQSKSKGKFTLDSAKLVEMKSRDKVSLMSVVGMNTSTPNLNTLTFPMSGSTQRVSLTTTQAGSSAGVVSFAVAQPSMTQANQKNWQQHSISVQDVLNSSVQSQRTPVTVMATLRISNPSSGSQSANIHGAIITNSNTDNPGTPVSSSYLTTASNENQSTIGTLFIAPSSRHHYSKGSIGDNNTTTIPFALSTLGPHVASQLKNSQRLISGHQSVSPSINLALTPTTPQKHTLSQLSIPHTSGNSPAVLIATPAGGSVASGLPSFRTTVMEAGTAAMVSGGSNGSNGSQTKTVSINVARLTLQQPNSEISSGTPSSVTSTIVSHSHGSHSAQTWVPSGSGPNILKLGPSGVGATGIQIHPVLPQRTLGVKQETTDRIFKMGGNKALTVISKRMRNPVVNATRTISIGNSKQQVTNINNNKTAASSHMTLLPDGRTALAKPYISIGHAAKNNAAATVVPDTKGMPVVEQSCLLTNSDKMPPQISEGQAGQVSVTDASSGLNKPSKNNQAMEVT